ncbi:protein NinF [Buttiauxella noackiae]|uniref:protein NinF n=1 Tax=Buttiauxella noackiae TaxID=82992 RepID=UPI0028D7E793|nr:protein NinF [Buttiauxella noackiae]
MLQPSDITTYQRNSNAAAGYCAACTKPLQPGEVYACNECASDAYVERDQNYRMEESDDN